MFGIWWLKYALIAAAIAAVAIYIGILKVEVHHYQKVAEENKQEYLVYRANAEAKDKIQQEAFSAMTLKYKQALIDSWKSTEAKNKAIKERIATDEASKHIVLPDSSVQLFNSSAANSGDTAATTEQGNASGASTAEVPYTLNDLLSVSADNNSEHWKCIDQVHQWQQFWTDFQAGVAKADTVGRSP